MRAFLFIAILTALAGCQSSPSSTATVPAPVAEFNAPVKQIEVEALSTYWVTAPSKPKMLRKRPEWLPEGAGRWQVKTVIDSNGNVVEKTLISSQPKGFMTQEMVDAMPRDTFTPAATNPERIPVSFIGTAVVGPRP